LRLPHRTDPPPSVLFLVPEHESNRRTIAEASHKVVEEVLITVLVAVLLDVLLGKDIIVGVVSTPCKLLVLLSYACFLFSLSRVSICDRGYMGVQRPIGCLKWHRQEVVSEEYCRVAKGRRCVHGHSRAESIDIDGSGT
jgi:hypothetical protein